MFRSQLNWVLALLKKNSCYHSLELLEPHACPPTCTDTNGLRSPEPERISGDLPTPHPAYSSTEGGTSLFTGPGPRQDEVVLMQAEKQQLFHHQMMTNPLLINAPPESLFTYTTETRSVMDYGQAQVIHFLFLKYCNICHRRRWPTQFTSWKIFRFWPFTCNSKTT